ncbi:MAG: heat-inducible transcription repressor HrcA [Thiotrichales bacterium]|nr:heat-inducible transcription repressor HrcA [Thiotrichales bacterium]
MLSDRYQMLFKNLMGLYLSDGKPVGSSTLSKLPEVSLSSATVRNVLADLEQMGLLHSPHTSAGRVPTDLGYRFFVDSLLTFQLPTLGHEHAIRQQLSTDLNQDRLLQETAKLLSGMTGMASVVMLPSKAQETLQQVDFLMLSPKRVLMVLVFSDQDVQNRVVELEQSISADQLHALANFLNAECLGLSLRHARAKLMATLARVEQEHQTAELALLQSADALLSQQASERRPLMVAGKTKLIDYEEFADSQKLRQLYHALQDEQALLELFDKTLQAPGLKVFIGSEFGDDVYQSCSLVARPYTMEGEVLGVLGVIGPSRMNYQKVVPQVDLTGKILSSLLKK